ncbi:hypothetical protein LTR10_024209 [Elasticomyces elasticus]|nr:hypothetical protein LTR10_024209 [Elasticomyces elasticus]
MATYDPVRHQLNYWDSHPNERARQRNIVRAHNFLDAMIQEYGDRIIRPEFRGQAPRHGLGHGPIQENYSDCGIFAVENARRFIEETGDINIAPITTALRSHLLEEFRTYTHVNHGDLIPDAEQAAEQQLAYQQALQAQGGQSLQAPFVIDSPPLRPRPGSRPSTPQNPQSRPSSRQSQRGGNTPR